jgi:hypothetical protein
MKILATFLATILLTNTLSAQISDHPKWAKDLIIYELSPKAFTSPNGPETGTFKSTMEKIPYLADLGITGIWLTGNNWSDNSHFYGIWTQYATIRPDSIDPTLGTRADLKSLVDLCHKYNIKVFLDVITHGVMNYSPLIKEHPEWFRDGSWGMTDYDWKGKHQDLDDWWVKTFTDYTLQCGIDGYRLDVAIYRPDLWKKIKTNCQTAGHQIVVWSEGDAYSDGLCDFHQRQTTLSIQTSGLDAYNPLNTNAVKYFDDFKKSPGYYFVKVFYTDGSVSIGNSWNDDSKTESTVNQLWWLKELKPYKDLKVNLVQEIKIAPCNIKTKIKQAETIIELSNLKTDKSISGVSITGTNLWEENWRLDSPSELKISLPATDKLTLNLEPIIPDLKLFSILLSSHDDGWETFPPDANPYVSEGSRCTWAYSCMFLPAIPIFMSGEEFDAEYVALPRHTADLYGKGEQGKGKWLYASQIQWDQLSLPRHANMLKDVKKMIAIRKAENDIFRAHDNDSLPDISEAGYECIDNIPVPYTIQNKKKILIIAGNNQDKDVKITLKLELNKLGLQPSNTYTLIDLWNDKKYKISGKDLESYTFSIKKDKTPGGGIAVFKIISDK